MKKTLSLLLALIMLLSMIPMTAFAAEAYVISDKALSEGSNTVSLDSSAEYTLFAFTSDTAATYTFTASSGVQLANYGSSFFPQNITVADGQTMTNTLSLTFTASGVTKLIGVYNPSGSSSSISLKVEQGADYVEYVVPLYTYENKATLSQFEVPSDAVLGSYIDVYSSTNHKAVKGSDGYYHLDSASGDILLVDLDYAFKLSDALSGGRGIMYAYTTDANGNQIKYDIGNAIKEYEAVADSGLRYPLTEDLMFFYQDYAEGNGVYQYVLGSGYNEETAWMYACLTMQVSSSSTEPTTPPATELAAPVVSASNVASSGKIKLTWKAVENAVKYEIYRADSASGTFSKKYTTSGTSYTNTSATAGNTYYYYVKAIAADGTSANSSVVSCICKLAQPAIKVSNVASSGAVKVTWEEVPGAVEYEVYRANSKNGTYTLKYTTKGTSYTNSGATLAKTYYYKVKAIAANEAANSEFSTIKSRTRDLAQTTVTLSNRASDGKITVKWEAVTGATKYEVYRATSKDGTYTRISTTKNTSITNTSTTAGKTYYYKVRAICDVDAAVAAFSGVKSRTCDLPQPDLSIGRSSGKPKLSWDKVSGAVSYKIYRATSKNGTYSLVKTTTSLSWKDTTAKKNKTYYYKVVAVCSNTSGNSAYSGIKSIKATK